jgi:hypothetical protein
MKRSVESQDSIWSVRVWRLLAISTVDATQLVDLFITREIFLLRFDALTGFNTQGTLRADRAWSESG